MMDGSFDVNAMNMMGMMMNPMMQYQALQMQAAQVSGDRGLALCCCA